jgi:DNA repair exonuclease SbcCD ATPase subunit/DNA repair exonuclease SbcCD nuclease subunit
MIKKILQIADIHIHSSTKRYEEYQIVFDRLYKYIEEQKPDRIVISGDLFEDFVLVSNEAKIFAGKFLTHLSTYCKVILTLGNHDLMKRNKKRTPTPETLTELMNNANILYLNKSGFFEDDDIVWVNYSHMEKDIHPWRDIPNEKDDTKTYIALFHDPIYGCKLPNGMLMEKKSLVNLETFKNDDLLLAGDIHLRQYFSKTMAFSGSLIQQHFGEKPYGHGGILWIIDKKITSEDFDIENDLVYINEYLEEEDYDNLKTPISKYVSKYTKLKIFWKDYSVNMNNENEQKIRNYFSELYSIEKDTIKFTKKYLNTSLVNTNQLDEKLDLNNKKGLQEIFETYLKENKYKKTQIKELIDLDDIISDKLDINELETDVNWKIEKLWIDNFKSYDKADLDFIGKDGLTQLNGKNQQGKTTLIDAICYVFFGTTLATNKLGGALREKHGDNRFINNKQSKNYCKVGAQINADGETFIIERLTERTLTKTGIIKSVSTLLDYYDDEVSEDNKQTDEQKKDTQNKLDNILGNFEDFIRLTLTNSENLNQLLSLDRATFIDSIIRDAGYDIFEKKSDIFKDYKKENLKNKIILDIDQSQEELKEITESKEDYTDKLNILNIKVKDVNLKIEDKEKLKENEVKTLNKIDENVGNLDIDDLNIKIQEYNHNISNNLKSQKKNLELMKDLKSEYDEDEYDSKHFDIRRIKDLNSDLKIKNSDYDNRVDKENSTIEKVDLKIEQVIKLEIDKNRRKIEHTQDNIYSVKKEFNLKMESQINDVQSEMKDYQYKIKSNETELEHIKDSGKKIKKEIKTLEDDSMCPTCGQDYTEEHNSHKEKNINDKKNEIKQLFVEVKENMSENQLYNEKLEGFEKEIEQIKTKNFTGDLKELYDDVVDQISVKEVLIKNVMLECSKLDNKNFENSPAVYHKVTEGLKIKKKCLENIEECGRRKEKTKEEISRNYNSIDELEDDLLILEKEKSEVKTYNKLRQENSENKLKIENVKLTIINAKNKIEQYNNQLENIEKNRIIEEKISKIQKDIEYKNKDKQELNDKLNDIKSELVVLTRDFEDLTKRIELYNEQVKLEELYKEYSKIIHRDGIPTYLLKQSINLINYELDELLSDVDFIVKFDDELKLKLAPKSNIKAEINSLESSGKERTFIALALKAALRTINNKPKCDLSIFDEVMGKLVDNSVDEFLQFVDLLRQRISMIFVIEHNHDVDCDYVINVEKNNNGVSSLSYE